MSVLGKLENLLTAFQDFQCSPIGRVLRNHFQTSLRRVEPVVIKRDGLMHGLAQRTDVARRESEACNAVENEFRRATAYVADHYRTAVTERFVHYQSPRFPVAGKHHRGADFQQFADMVGSLVTEKTDRCLQPPRHRVALKTIPLASWPGEEQFGFRQTLMNSTECGEQAVEPLFLRHSS